MSILETFEKFACNNGKKCPITTFGDQMMQSYFQIKVEHQIFCLLYLSVSLWYAFGDDVFANIF